MPVTFMKIVITLIIWTFSTTIRGQEIDIGVPDSLETIKLEYETVDSMAIIKRNPHKRIGNIVSYDNYRTKLGYYKTDRNKWTSVSLPFSGQADTFYFINIDKNGGQELIIKGEDRQ